MRVRHSKRQRTLIAENLRFAKRFVSQDLPPVLLEQLRELVRNFSLSLKCGDLLLLSRGWFVTHTGLIRLARRKRYRGIHVEAVDSLCDSAVNRFVLKATVYPSKNSAGFVGTATQTLLTSRCWSAAPRCASQKPEPSIVLCQGVWHRDLLGRRDRV